MKRNNEQTTNRLGNLEFRTEIAKFVGERIFGRAVDAKHVGIAAGASAMVCVMCCCLFVVVFCVCIVLFVLFAFVFVHVFIVCGQMNLLMYAICDPGDAAIIPTPYYAGLLFVSSSVCVSISFVCLCVSSPRLLSVNRF